MRRISHFFRAAVEAVRTFMRPTAGQIIRANRLHGLPVVCPGPDCPVCELDALELAALDAPKVEEPSPSQEIDVTLWSDKGSTTIKATPFDELPDFDENLCLLGETDLPEVETQPLNPNPFVIESPNPCAESLPAASSSFGGTGTYAATEATTNDVPAVFPVSVVQLRMAEWSNPIGVGEYVGVSDGGRAYDFASHGGTDRARVGRAAADSVGTIGDGEATVNVSMESLPAPRFTCGCDEAAGFECNRHRSKSESGREVELTVDEQALLEWILETLVEGPLNGIGGWSHEDTVTFDALFNKLVD